jgi:hypothetical protein
MLRNTCHKSLTFSLSASELREREDLVFAAAAGPPEKRGWMAYFRLAELRTTFRDLDGWLRRRLRQVRWKEWKTTAAKRHNLRIRGISESKARKWGGSSKGYWRVASSQVLQAALPSSYWDRLGLKTLTATWQRLNRTA